MLQGDTATYELDQPQPSPMNSIATSAAELAVADDNSAAVARAGPAIVMRCLLVSVDQCSTELIEATAGSEGWLAEKCRTVDQAMRLAFRQEFHLAFVDIESVSGSEQRVEFEQLAHDLAQSHVPLLVISGDPDDPFAEIHARQLGVWLYLPGFDGMTELDVVFREARAVHEKLRAECPDDNKQLVGGIEQSASSRTR